MQIPGYIAITTGVMGSRFWGNKYLIYNYGFPPCYIMKKSQQFKFKKANTPPGEIVTSFPCLAFADIGGK